MPLILIGMRSPGKMRSISRNAWAFRSIGCDNPIQIAQNKNLPLRPAYVRRSTMTGFLYKLFALSVLAIRSPRPKGSEKGKAIRHFSRERAFRQCLRQKSHGMLRILFSVEYPLGFSRVSSGRDSTSQIQLSSRVFHGLLQKNVQGGSIAVSIAAGGLAAPLLGDKVRGVAGFDAAAHSSAPGQSLQAAVGLSQVACVEGAVGTFRTAAAKIRHLHPPLRSAPRCGAGLPEWSAGFPAPPVRSGQSKKLAEYGRPGRGERVPVLKQPHFG